MGLEPPECFKLDRLVLDRSRGAAVDAPAWGRKLIYHLVSSNRAAKDIDFGFGTVFGTPKILSPGAPAHASQPESTIPRTRRSSSRRTPTPDRRPITSSPLPRQTPIGTQNKSSSRSTPESGRNTRPQRTSIFDIPPDDGADQGREHKRRRIVPFEPIPEDTIVNSESEHVREPDTRTAASGAKPFPDEPSNLGEVGHEYRASLTGRHTEENGAQLPEGQPERQNEEPVDIAVDRIQEKGESRPHKKSVHRRKRKSVVQGPKRRKRASLAGQLRTEPNQEAEPEPGPSPAPVSGPELETEQEFGPGPGPEPELHSVEAEETYGRSHTVEPVGLPRRDPKKRKSVRQLLTRHKRRGTLVHAQTQEHQNEEQITRSEEPDENSVGDDNEVNASHEEDGQKRSTSPKQMTRPRRKSRRTVKGRGRQRQQPQPEQIEENVQEPSQSRPPQRKRRSRKSSEEPNAEGEPESRGGTVPVVVHRFANLSALRNVTGDDEGTPSETAQPDDPFGHHKYPSRSGVNPADVLGQICRETLEKTISKLAEGIEQESNSARRVEWTRKRKTVELFGVELEQRLFDMSELLDSNFVLSARLKREKRDIAFLRNRLVELRKEREDVALRIDEVRRKYTEDEHVKTEHDNLNNSLHNLQLAIDRGRKVDDEPVAHPVIGLEFLLRTVAHDVSSTAPGSHGGILHHVKSFNNELERTATLLEQL
ncbi:AT hook domain-containing protein [Histoplasma capsulatum]|uniref:AT hook domain-containing protein n=1 Tax=Ajellomyces capsulatus TaxID=5037 RepID=A0A8A1MCD1_AJECA|nr:AT hook domain-containing protein [Histoplasma capsulatum]